MLDINDNVSHDEEEEDDITNSQGEQALVKSWFKLRRPQDHYGSDVAKEPQTSYARYQIGLNMASPAVEQVLSTGTVFVIELGEQAWVIHSLGLRHLEL